MSADYGRSGSGWSCCLCQVVELLQTFSLYTEHLDPSTAVKPDVDDRMWLLTADRTPYHEGLLALPLSCLQSLYCNYCCLILFVSPPCEAGTLSLPCPFTSSSFALFTFPFLSLALLIFFFCPSLSFIPE